MTLVGLSLDSTWLKREQMSLNIGLSIQTSKTKCKEQKRMKKDRTDRLRTVGQL